MAVAPITIELNTYQSKESCPVCLDEFKSVMIGHNHPTDADARIHLVCRECFDRLDPKRCPECRAPYIEEDERIERPRELAIDIHDIEVEGARPAESRPGQCCFAVSTILFAGAVIGMVAGAFAASIAEPSNSELLEYLGYGAASGLGSSFLLLACANWQRR